MTDIKDQLAKAMADRIGHGMSEKCEVYAEVAVEFFAGQIAALKKSKKSLGVIKELCGNVQGGTATTLKIGQDDATYKWVITSGQRTFFAGTFDGVLHVAEAWLKANKNETPGMAATGVVHVCPVKDIECGRAPELRCADCPLNERLHYDSVR